MLVPRVTPLPPPPEAAAAVAEKGFGGGGGGGGGGSVVDEVAAAASAQSKRMALQKKAAAAMVAAEDYARRFESGDLAVAAAVSELSWISIRGYEFSLCVNCCRVLVRGVDWVVVRFVNLRGLNLV